MTKVLRRGSRLGKYRLERRIGEGASATVWKARDTVEGLRVAAKVIEPDVAEQFGREAIEAEARVAAQLDHPRIVRLRNADWIDGRFVLVTDLARGSVESQRSLRRSPGRILQVFLDAAEGLAHAHARGVIHRDVKPGNLLLFDDQRVRLADFGVARLGQARTYVMTEAGTTGYMAPEQAYGRPRFASDVFALCLTAYELYAGVLPSWPFEWPLEGARRFESRCPAPLRPILRRGLALDLEHRFEDAVELHRALVRAAEQIGATADRAKNGKQRRPRSRKRPQSEPDPFALEAGWFRKRYGRALECHYDCHACDGPISESMRHCPWCGSDRNAFREVTRFPMVCPECERGVRPEWGACPTCAKGRFEADGRAIPGARTAERRCPRPGCGAPIHRFMHYCPGCKKRVERPWKVEGLAGCPRCRWPLAPRWRFCGWCGWRNRSALTVGG